jgi:hypothetical protein
MGSMHCGPVFFGEFTTVETATVVSNFSSAGLSKSASSFASFSEWSSYRSTALLVRITGIRS